MSQPATARQISNAPEHSTAYYFIEGLNELGIEHLFCNFGTDHAPTIEAMAERQKRGEKVPNVMLCPHENTALKWLPKDGRFQCPKHESRYQPNGTFMSGRATRNMDRLAIRRDGDAVYVDLSHIIKSDTDAAAWAAATLAL